MKEQTYWNFSKIAAVFIVVFAAAFAIYYFGPDFQQANSTEGKEITSVELPDGTMVTLNENSKIRYPYRFDRENRRVVLTGEAYIEVMAIPEKPFIITTETTEVEVRGTEFNINAYEKNENVVVMVIEGTAELYSKSSPAEKILLESGMTGIFNKSNQNLSRKQEADINQLAWKTKKIIMDNYTLSEAVQLLENVYKTSIILQDQNLANCPISASFDQMTLESVFNVIETALDVEIKNVNGDYIIEGKGC